MACGGTEARRPEDLTASVLNIDQGPQNSVQCFVQELHSLLPHQQEAAEPFYYLTHSTAFTCLDIHLSGHPEQHKEVGIGLLSQRLALEAAQFKDDSLHD